MPMLATKSITDSAAGSISESEWKVRQDLAACYRLFVHYGWTDLIFTHLSARVPWGGRSVPDQPLRAVVR